MLEMNEYFGHELLSSFRNKSLANILAPLLIGVAFVGMGSCTYIRIYDEHKHNSKLFSFGIVCLILGSCCMVLSICWFVFDYRDRREITTHSRQHFMDRIFFLNLQNSFSQSDNAIYSNYLNAEYNSTQFNGEPPPTYQQAILSPITIYPDHLSINSIQYKNGNKSNQIISSDVIAELSVIDLRNLCPPTYDDALKMNDLNESTKL